MAWSASRDGDLVTNMRQLMTCINGRDAAARRYVFSVPEGRGRLAGGANHRLIANVSPKPWKGVGNRALLFGRPCRGSNPMLWPNRWFAPPANLRRPSGTLNTYL